jgi:hypothetical protein
MAAPAGSGLVCKLVCRLVCRLVCHLGSDSACDGLVLEDLDFDGLDFDGLAFEDLAFDDLHFHSSAHSHVRNMYLHAAGTKRKDF